QLVVDRYHARDVPDLPHDVAAERGGLRAPLCGHDAGLDRHRELTRVFSEPAHDDVAGDLLADVIVRTVVDGEHVGPADQPDQAAVRVDHGHPLDLQEVHQLGGVLDRVLGPDRHRPGCHQVARGQAFGLADILVVQHSSEHARVGQRLLGQQVGLGDDADHLLVLVDDGEGADPVLAQSGRHLLEGSTAPDRHHLGGHDVLDGGVHCYSLSRVRTTLSAPVSAARADTSYASSKSSMSKWWVMNGLASIWPVVIRRIRVGVEEVSTRPVVIVMSLIHCSSRCSATGSPCTPMLAIRPPGRASLTASSKAAGTPTASMDTSAPSRPVRSLVTASGSSRALFTVTSAPNRLAASRRASDRPMATMWLGLYSRAVAIAARPTGPVPTTATTSPGRTAPASTPTS